MRSKIYQCEMTHTPFSLRSFHLYFWTLAISLLKAVGTIFGLGGGAKKFLFKSHFISKGYNFVH